MKLSRLSLAALAMSALVLALTGCGKSANTVAPAISLDTTPPDAPTNLVGSYDAAASRDYLNWTPSTAADLAGYEVWQYDADPATGATGQVIASTDASADGVGLPATSDAGTHWFRVRAIDGAGNKSTYSSSTTYDTHVWDGTSGVPGGHGVDSGL